MKIKKGDTVKMLAGKDRGKTGKVIKVDSSFKKAVIEGLNLLKKNKRPKRQGEKGEIVSIPRAVDISNVALLCPHCKKAARVGYLLEDADSKNKKTRICKKCQTRLE